MPTFRIFTLAIILQCCFKAMPTKLGPPNNAATAGHSHESKTITIKMQIHWHKLKDLKYVNHLDRMATPENETIGDGRFQITLFPINSKNADKPHGKPIMATTGHYDLATLNVPKEFINVSKRDRRKADYGSGGFMVEIKMNMHSATDEDKWKNAQVISKEIKYPLKEREILICEFVNGGTCFAEEYKMDKTDRPWKKITFLFNEVKKEFGKIGKIECALLEKEEKHFDSDNCFRSNVCLEDKYTLHFENGKKIEINCDESIFEWHNVYKIKRRVGMEGFLCKLEVNKGNKGNLDETKIVAAVTQIETEIMMIFWKLYHTKMNLLNELDKLYKVKEQKVDKSLDMKLQIELLNLDQRKKFLKPENALLLDHCVKLQNVIKSASSVPALSTPILEAKDKKGKSKVSAAKMATYNESPNKIDNATAGIHASSSQGNKLSPAKTQSFEEGEIQDDQKEEMQTQTTDQEHEETMLRGESEAAATDRSNVTEKSGFKALYHLASASYILSPANLQSKVDQAAFDDYLKVMRMNVKKLDKAKKETGKNVLRTQINYPNQFDLNSTPPADEPGSSSIPNTTHSLALAQSTSPNLGILSANANSPQPLLLEQGPSGSGDDKRKRAEDEDDDAIIHIPSESRHDDVNDGAGTSGNQQLAKKQKNKDFDFNV